VALALAEGALRLLVPEPQNVRFETAIERAEGLGHHQLVHDVLENDPVLFWRLKPNLTLPTTDRFFPGVVSNGQGLRERHEIGLDKPPGEVRVLFLGDSCTFGWGVKEEESIPALVEASLRARFPHAAIECINAGVPAYSLLQGYLFLKEEGLAYQPDLVVVSFGTNDMVSWGDQSDIEHYRAQLASQPPAALRWSRVLRLAWGVLGPLAGPRSLPADVVEIPDARVGALLREADAAKQPDSEETSGRTVAGGRPPVEGTSGEPGGHLRVPATEFGYLLGRVQAAAKLRDAELLLVTWPYPWNLEPPLDERTALQQVIDGFARLRTRFGPAGDPAHVDLVPVVQDLSRTVPAAAIFQDPLHSTAVANRRFADAVAARIAPWLEARVGVVGGGGPPPPRP
jgi:lysophospholipase L1-like esterase